MLTHIDFQVDSLLFAPAALRSPACMLMLLLLLTLPHADTDTCSVLCHTLCQCWCLEC